MDSKDDVMEAYRRSVERLMGIAMVQDLQEKVDADHDYKAENKEDEQAVKERKDAESKLSPIDIEHAKEKASYSLNVLGNGFDSRGELGFQGLTLGLFKKYRKPTRYGIEHHLKYETKSHADMEAIMNQLARDMEAYAKKNGYVFQAINILSDWHHGKGENKKKGNGKDLHFHMVLFGIPKTPMVDYAINWWKRKRLGYMSNGKDGKSGTIRLNREIDFGWITYIKDNYDYSTKHTARIFGNGIDRSSGLWFGRRWSLWGKLLPPKGTRDESLDEGAVDDDGFDEF